MKVNETTTAVCPCCGKTYTDRPAISREDNQTPICPDCGTREALSAMGVSVEEQEEIIEIIHRSQKGLRQEVPPAA